jgi:uncharacterized protein
MSPEERQLLNGLFDRTRSAGSAPRDAEAETLIADQVRSQPYAPYLLAQAVIVQEQALKAANDKLQELQAKIQELEQHQPGRPPAPAGSGFLSGLGSLFGSDPQQQPQRGPAPGPWGQPAPGYGQPNYAPPPQGQPQSMWGQNAPQAGGFLKGALGAAAGVAGGVLLADSIRGLFGGHNNALGIGSGFGGFGQPGGETIVNNYYEGGNDPGGNFGGNDGYANDGSYDDAGSSDGNFDD